MEKINDITPEHIEAPDMSDYCDHDLQNDPAVIKMFQQASEPSPKAQPTVENLNTSISIEKPEPSVQEAPRNDMHDVDAAIKENFDDNFDVNLIDRQKALSIANKNNEIDLEDIMSYADLYAHEHGGDLTEFNAQLRKLDRIAHVPGIADVFDDLNSSNEKKQLGAQFQLDWASKYADDVAGLACPRIKTKNNERVYGDAVEDGEGYALTDKEGADVELKDGTAVELKNYNLDRLDNTYFAKKNAEKWADQAAARVLDGYPQAVTIINGQNGEMSSTLETALNNAYDVKNAEIGNVLFSPQNLENSSLDQFRERYMANSNKLISWKLEK